MKKDAPCGYPYSFTAESEGFEGTDIAYGNPTSKTLMPAGGILGKARARETE